MGCMSLRRRVGEVVGLDWMLTKAYAVVAGYLHSACPESRNVCNAVSWAKRQQSSPNGPCWRSQHAGDLGFGLQLCLCPVRHISQNLWTCGNVRVLLGMLRFGHQWADFYFLIGQDGVVSKKLITCLPQPSASGGPGLLLTCWRHSSLKNESLNGANH